MIKLLHHLLLPHQSNNYRPKILHPKVLLLFILFFFSAGILMSVTRKNYPQVLGIEANISTDKLLILTNQKRAEVGLPALKINNELDQAAASKGNNMLSNNYWAHIGPDGTTPWYFIKGAGYNYVYAGENLARGYNSADDVINAWMASPSHKENMLSKNYQDVGFAVVTGKLTGEDTVLVVEEFGSKDIVEDNLAQDAPVDSDSNELPVQQETKSTASALVKTSARAITPLINGQTFSSNIAAITVTIFMFVLILDMIIIERKKILRFVGHNLDHVMFFILISALIIIVLKGYVI